MKPLIMVVDDDDMSRKLAREFLMVSGFGVVEACDGEECLLFVASKRPALIVLDMRMPRLDGIETIRRLKGNPETRSIPIIMLSASAMVKEKQEMLASGCDAILSKPVDLEKLLVTVRLLLRDGVAESVEEERGCVKVQEVECDRRTKTE